MHPDIAYEVIQRTAEQRRADAEGRRLADTLPRRERSWRIGSYRLILRNEGRRVPRPA